MAELTFAGLGGWSGVLGRLSSGEPLSTEESECVLGQVLDGEATEAQIAALLIALRVKGETVDEMVGFVRSILAHAEPLAIEGDVLDLVGTGGDRLGSINVTTLAALIAAGAGARVCKHGNRAASSSVGTADVLEALGVVVDLGPAGVASCLAEAGMGFCFAPRFHPAFRHVGPVRRQLGVPTVFNFLGPLANPARARHQLVGVSDARMAETMAGVLGANGSHRSMVMFADDGLDELSVTSPSTVVELTGDGSSFELTTWRLEPGDLGIPAATLDDLSGGDAAFNATAIRAVLDGRAGPHRDIGVLNAAAGLVVAGLTPDLVAGIEMSAAAIDSGAAAGVLDRLVAASAKAAAAQAQSV
ncbi:MAG: anthranilate phosphoribosyltransferase [Acidimicrobiales bacterium]